MVDRFWKRKFAAKEFPDLFWTFFNSQGRQLYPDEVPSLPLSSNNLSSSNNPRKSSRYRFHVLVMRLSQLSFLRFNCGASVRPPALPLRSLHGLFGSPTSPFLLGRNPPGPSNNCPREVDWLGATISGISVKRRWMNAHCTTYTTIVTGSSSWLA